MAFNAKNLSYDAKEPAFLRKLRQEQAGISPGDGRHARAAARPRGKQLLDDDDEPTYVNEDSDLLSKTDVEKLMAGKIDDRERTLDEHNLEKGSARPAEGHSEKTKTEQWDAKTNNSVASNIKKKRKIGKIIGQSSATDLDVSGKPEPTEPKKKKKSKAVTLSFLDDAEKS